MVSILNRVGCLAVLFVSGCLPTSDEKSSASGCCRESKITPVTTEVESEPSACCQGCTVAVSTTVAEEPKPVEKITTVELKTVKYDGLIRAVRENKGKVIVLDVWASYCAPCRAEFPHLLDLSRKYGPDGLVCISVSVDEEKNVKLALDFLTKKNARILNYRLDEEGAFWQDKWDIKGIPAVFVFDRAGARAAKFTNDDPDNQFTYDKHVEPLVRKLLAAKP